MKTRLIRFALWMADWNTSRAVFWNDVAEAIATQRTVKQVRADRSGEAA